MVSLIDLLAEKIVVLFGECYSKRFTPLYVAEACYKYNNRKNKRTFETFVTGCFA